MLLLTITYGGTSISVNCVGAKANRMLRLIKRAFKSLNNLKTLRTLDCSLVRSNLNIALWYGARIHIRTLTSLKEPRDEILNFF